MTYRSRIGVPENQYWTSKAMHECYDVCLFVVKSRVGKREEKGDEGQKESGKSIAGGG